MQMVKTGEELEGREQGWGFNEKMIISIHENFKQLK